MSEQPVGTYLIRLSATKPGSFTIAFIGSDKQVHQVILQNKTASSKEFYILDDQAFLTLKEVIDAYVKKGIFKEPCHLSKYEKKLYEAANHCNNLEKEIFEKKYDIGVAVKFNKYEVKIN